MADIVVLFDTFQGSGPLVGHVPEMAPVGAVWTDGINLLTRVGGAVREDALSPEGSANGPKISVPLGLENGVFVEMRLTGGNCVQQNQFSIAVVATIIVRYPAMNDSFSVEIKQNPISQGNYSISTGQTKLFRIEWDIENYSRTIYVDGVVAQVSNFYVGGAEYYTDAELDLSILYERVVPHGAGALVPMRLTDFKVGTLREPPTPPSGGQNLYKEKIVTYTPGRQGVAPSPGSPARTAYETRQVCRFVPVASLPGAGGGGGVDLGGPNPGGGSNNYIWVCSLEQVLVTYPAVPPTAGSSSIQPSTNVDYQLGWNAGARSIGFFTDDGSGQFQVRASVVGVICGLNSADAVDDGYSGRNIDYAFSLARGVARIVENGTFVASAGAYTDDTVFKIARVGTEIAYSMDSVVVHITEGATGAPLWLEAALYAGDDEVMKPFIVQEGAPDLSEQSGSINARLPALGVFASATPFAELRGVLPPLGGRLEAGLSAPAYAVGNFVLPPLFSTSTSLTGGVGQIDASLPALDMLAADHAYAELRGVLPPLGGVLYAVEGNEIASMGSSASAAARLSPLVFLIAEMTSSGLITSAFLAEVVVPAEMLSAVELAGSFEFTSLMEAVMRSRAVAGGLVAIPGADTETFAFNVDSGGSTSYTRFGFNSYAQLGGRFYGANERGIFALQGNTDEGAPIRACINLGKLDFGSSTKKTISECFIGMSAAGNLFVKVLAEGRTFIYKTQAFSEQIQQQRVKFGMGLRTNYVELEIYNEGGADFEIDTVEFSVADLSRKL